MLLLGNKIQKLPKKRMDILHKLHNVEKKTLSLTQMHMGFFFLKIQKTGLGKKSRRR